MLWACFEKRRRIRREESDGDGGAGLKEGEEDQSGGGWIASGTTCLSERGLSEEDAQDRPRRRRLTRHIDPT